MILSPKMPKKLVPIPGTQIHFLHEDSLTGKEITSALIVKENVERVVFQQVIFKNTDFSGISLKYLDCMDVRFENCNLSNVDFGGAVIHRTEMINCNGVGLNLGESTLRNLIFKGSNLKYACFRFSNLDQVLFRSCQMQQSDFHKSVLSNTGFQDSDLRQVQLSGTKLKGIDFSSCDIEGVGVRMEDLQGAVVTPAQAVSISRILGLILKE